jgi:hypothetical protein
MKKKFLWMSLSAFSVILILGIFTEDAAQDQGISHEDVIV